MTSAVQNPSITTSGAAGRILALDLARSAALLGMAIFHFTHDLAMFGLIAPGTTLVGGWAIFARIVAGSFLGLAGFSLVLAQGQGIRWRAFLRRLAVIAAAAALVSVATYLAMPEAYIFFGILHAIAAASVLGLLFLRLPVWAILAVALAVVLAPVYLRAPAFDAPWLLWVGLFTETPRTLDFEPLLPWFAPFLAGMAAARIARGTGLLQRLRSAGPTGPILSALAWPGRHSLAVYLIHQPALIGLIWVALWFVG
jgi:uncharacterized membrane protein